MSAFQNFLKSLPTFSKASVGSEYLTKSKPSVVTLVSQISCAVQKQILFIFVVVVFSFDFVVWNEF